MTPISSFRAPSQLKNRKLSLLVMSILALGFMLASPFTPTASAHLDRLKINFDPSLTQETAGNGNGLIEPGESGSVGFRVTRTGGLNVYSRYIEVEVYGAALTSYTEYGDWSGANHEQIIYAQFDVEPGGCGGGEIQIELMIDWIALQVHYPDFGRAYGSGAAWVEYIYDINTKTFSYTDAPVAIPDDNENGVDAYLPVSGATTITDLEFIINGSSCSSAPGSTTVGLDHANVHDLVLTLTSPSGTTVTLIDRPGDATNTGSNFCNLVLDDNEGNPLIQSITSGSAPYSGTFAPANPLSAFIGEDPNGWWTLNVSDRAAANTGQVNAFSLTITDDSPDCDYREQSIQGRVTTNGTTALPGVMIKALGWRTVLTDEDGNYGLALPQRNSYTVKPFKLGYLFNPVSRYFSVLDIDSTADFIATKANFSISGKVTGPGSTTGLSGVTVRLTGDRVISVTTAADGQYKFSNLPASGNYTVTPFMIGYRFTPASGTYSELSANQTNQNFTARTQNHTVSGIVRLGAARLDGVTITLSSPAPAGFPARTATTNSNGAYSFPGLPAGRNYTVTATKIGYQFIPLNKSLANLSANQAVNFDVKVYSISGRVTKTGSAAGISSVTMTLTSPTPAGFAARTALTNSTGNYTFTNLPAGRSYAIKPTKTGSTFTPAMRSITNLSNNIAVGPSTSFTGVP